MRYLTARIRPIASIAFNTYREAVRSKILYGILFFGLFLIVFAGFLGNFSLNQNQRVILDIGLFAISLFGSVMAIFLGASFVHKEIERKSIYAILSKPIRRWHYFVGKFLGILLTLFLQLIVMMILHVTVLKLWGLSVPGSLYIAFGLLLVEVMVVTTVALLFSSFSTPYLSAILTLGVYIGGKAAELLQTAASSAENSMLILLIGLADRIVPALYTFNRSTEVTYDLPIPSAFVFNAVVYGLCYTAIVLTLGALIFSRRDFI
jgi:ABC-type transport system involved in multi-copper enzyme maturation permease subunit